MTERGWTTPSHIAPASHRPHHVPSRVRTPAEVEARGFAAVEMALDYAGEAKRRLDDAEAGGDGWMGWLARRSAGLPSYPPSLQHGGLRPGAAMAAASPAGLGRPATAASELAQAGYLVAAGVPSEVASMRFLSSRSATGFDGQPKLPAATAFELEDLAEGSLPLPPGCPPEIERILRSKLVGKYLQAELFVRRAR